MSADLDKNKAVVERFMDEVSDCGDLSVLDELCAPDVVNHAARAELRDGIDAFKELMGIVHGSQMDRHWTEQHYLADGDLVVVYGVREGTWQAPAFRGVSTPQKGHVSTELAHMFRLRDGLITEHWAVRDDLGMLQQLGALIRTVEFRRGRSCAPAAAGSHRGEVVARRCRSALNDSGDALSSGQAATYWTDAARKTSSGGAIR